jgi:hypothetical protein
MIQPDKLPIVIIANYRTGSSALASSFSRNLKLLPFQEPHYRPDYMLSFKQCLSDGKKSFVLKAIAEQLDTIEEYKSVFDSNCFKIKLYRENKIEQIVSYYIATMTDTWGHYIDTPKQLYFVPYDDKIAKYAVDRILLNDRILDNLDVEFDITTTYEQLGLIENTKLIKTMQPTNLRKIRQFIEKVYYESR